MKLLLIFLLRIYSHKRMIFISGIILISIIIGMFFYMGNASKVTTYYVAYIGRYHRPGFDKLHELALRKYIDEMNLELNGVRLELQTYDNKKNPNVSKTLYEKISADDKIVVVVDNTWGKEFQHAADLIRENNIPVIAINADKQEADFLQNAVFVGHDDNIPKNVTDFSKQILKNSEIIFITEKTYALTDQFLKELNNSSTRIKKFTLSSDSVNSYEQDSLFMKLDTELKNKHHLQQRPTVIINTHAKWGVKIINHIDMNYKDINILGGPYIINWTNSGQFGKNKNNNKLIMLTQPKDAVSNKIYNDLKNIRISNPEFSEMPNAQLFIKRCMDAVSLIEGVFYDESAQVFRSSINRSDFINFFRSKLAGNDYKGKNDELYSFDENLLLYDEKTFEEYFQGEVTSYSKQLNSHRKVIPNIYFGIEIISISNIDIENRSFHADFFYWLKYDKNYSDIEKYIHFRNEKNSNKQELTSEENNSDSKVHKLYKMSADFSFDVDFKKYPLDMQELKIELEIINPADKLRISFDYAGFENSKKKTRNLNLEEWDMEDLYATVDNLIATSFHGSSGLENKKPQRFKTLNIRMPISRCIAGPCVTIILPLIMIGFAAIAILYVKDSSFSNVGEVCVGIFLSIVTYSIAFAEITPRSSVLTTADMLFYGTFTTVLLVFLKVIFFNSRMISDCIKNWASERATLIGMISFLSYCIMIIIILLISDFI